MTVDQGCPKEDYVLVVVQEVGSEQSRPLASYTVRELEQLTKDYTARQRRTRQAMQAIIYIAANITRGTGMASIHTVTATSTSIPRFQFSLPTWGWCKVWTVH